MAVTATCFLEMHMVSVGVKVGVKVGFKILCALIRKSDADISWKHPTYQGEIKPITWREWAGIRGLIK